MSNEARCVVCDGRFVAGASFLAKSLVGDLAVHEGCRAEAERRVYPHECPQCRGRGTIVTKWKEVLRCCQGGEPKVSPMAAFAGCEYCPDIGNEKVEAKREPCSLCDGRGRLEKEPVPVTSVTGWKRG